jgi:Kef-type K+ transport system membrane component KefB
VIKTVESLGATLRMRESTAWTTGEAPSSMPSLQLLSQVGVVLFMFVVGVEQLGAASCARLG